MNFFGEDAWAMEIESSIKQLDDFNYDNWIIWKVRIQLLLGALGQNNAILHDKPDEPTENSSPEEKKIYGKWELSNAYSLLLMQRKMADHVYAHLSLKANPDNAKQMFDALENVVMENERIEAPALLSKLVTMKYDGKDDVQTYLLGMSNLARRLKNADVSIPEYLIKQLALNSLPSQFNPVQLSYNMAKEKWDFIRLMQACVACECISNMRKREKENENRHFSVEQRGKGTKKMKNVRCFSCGQMGHFARNCR